MSRTPITCGACGTTLPAGKNGTWNLRHACPKAGTSAVDVAAGFLACPTHNVLVWTVGPYTTYRTCNVAGCSAGGTDKHGKAKPWRYFSARSGDTKGEIPRDTTPDPIPTPTPEVPAPMPDPAPHPTPALTPVRTTAEVIGSLKNLGSLGDMIAGYVEARATEIAGERVTDAIKSLGERAPLHVEWKVNDKPFAKIEGAHHKALPRLLKLYAAGFRNFLIVGPAGSGKTTLASNLATAIKTDFAHVSCTAGMSESALTGRAIPNLTTGTTEYQSTDFVRLYEGGGVFLLDEVDAADANVMLAINSGTANGHMALPNRESNPKAVRHPDSVIICAANTYGTGADRQYVGRNQLDAAFLDRFVGSTLTVDYDRDLESSLVGDAHICDRVWTIRDKVSSLKLRRVVGTRFLMSVARLVKGAGETIDAAILACAEGWTADEMTKCGVRS